jgi:N-acetylmuramoyl-L-alanine amidase
MSAAPLVITGLLSVSTVWAQSTGSGSKPVVRPSTGWSVAIEGQRTIAKRLELSGAGERARFVLDLTQPVTFEASAVDEPPRVLIAVPDLQFMPAADGRGHGLVTSYRYGLVSPGQARIVLDTAVPVKIARTEMKKASPGRPAQLVIDLVKHSAQDVFAPAVRDDPTPTEEPPSAPPSPAPREKPVVVIDPGHGGLDPGAVGAGGMLEKNIVMAVSRHVRALLAATGRYTVVMTRVGDTFVSLDHRLRISRQQDADLFISIHADSVTESLAQSVRGASVYTLSEQASDEQARRFAEKENAVDALAGLATPHAESGEVRTILADLLMRESANFSADFRGLLVTELRKHISLARDPQRSAAFKVLKQTRSPSVLIELGYMSHAEDQQLLTARDWQQRVAGSIAAAVESYFAKRTAGIAR